jgi:hypothetical protein
MSTETSKSLKRQWHIVRYLLNGVYVSTSNIREHLATLGIQTELRTIQRDMRVLEGIFPLECRQDSMPHSWRWQRDVSKGGMSLTQALTFRLVEDQLRDFLSPQLMQDLQPLFIRAKLVTGMANGTEQVERVSADIIKPSPKGGMEHGITGARYSPVSAILGGIQSLLGAMLASKEQKSSFQVLDLAVSDLVKIMRDEELDELVADF